jgi:hypothetical protein
VIKCWLAKEGEYWPGQSVGTSEYLRHSEAKTHGLRLLGGTTSPSPAWIVSFRCTNLHPAFRMSFELWIKKIANFIQAGSPFREASGRANKFKMLPQWWQLMEGEKREELHGIVYNKHQGKYTPECVAELLGTSISKSNLQALSVCLIVHDEMKTLPPPSLPPPSCSRCACF